MSADKFKQAYDQASEELLKRDKPRFHLGASTMGTRCPRQLWYGFRWFSLPKNDTTTQPRMRRLWQRGHDEEFNFVKYLRHMGIEVRDYSERLMYHDASDCYICMDWDAQPSHTGMEADDQIWKECDDVSDDPVHIRRATDRKQGPRQWRFTVDLGGTGEPVVDPRTGAQGEEIQAHAGGDCDGKVGPQVARWFPQVEGMGWGLLECKTHNDKSFKDLTKKGVKASKPTHWHQMQQYMRAFGLRWALYMAVNKNDDDIYPEIVMLDAATADRMRDRAMTIAAQRRAPPKMTEDPSWFECKFCPFRGVCHYGEGPDPSCRSCAYAEPLPGGRWRCNHHAQDIPREYLDKRCTAWESSE